MLELRAVVYDIGPRGKRRYVAIVESSIDLENSDFPTLEPMRITSSEFTIPPISLEEFSKSYDAPDKEELLEKIMQELSNPSKADKHISEIRNKLQNISTDEANKDDEDYFTIRIKKPKFLKK